MKTGNRKLESADPQPVANLQSELIDISYTMRQPLRRNDELAFDAAINGRADAWVIYKVRDFELPGEQFGIWIV